MIMFNELTRFLTKPELYAPSTKSLWDDEHISKGMLEAHLSPDSDAATRNPTFLAESVRWIAKIASPAQHKFLLNLGCGPGLYAEQFRKAGYSVTGLDFSRRSVAYAKEQTILNKSNIEYHYQDYLTISYTEQFDVITLIYCDYAALPTADRLSLLRKVHQALRPKGKFIFDVFTPTTRTEERRSWQYYAGGGFFSGDAHICLESVHQYDDEGPTELTQHIVITEKTVNCYNIWNRFFTKEALLSEVQSVGFSTSEFYGDIAGKKLSDTGETICGVVTK
jgi:SAM-dependent methyltransferase